MAGQHLRVVTHNIGSLIEPDWANRRHEIVSWLDHLEPDVVCLQEVWESSSVGNTATWIADHAAGVWHDAFGGESFGQAFGSDPTIKFGSAVLSRWPIEETNYHRLPVVPDGGDPFPTNVPWELFHARTAGLDVFSTHLSAAPSHGHHRRLQVMTIDELVHAARGTVDELGGFGTRRVGMPAILCGDFNAEPDSDEIRFLSSLATLDGRTTHWQDAFRVAGDGPGLTQDWRTNPIAASLNVHRKRIDYVFVGDPFMREGSAGRVVSARVVLDEARTGVLGSDHAGVMAEVVWPDRPSG